MIHDERVQTLNDGRAGGGRYVLYWMQQAQRVADNHALEFAIRQANERRLPLVVVVGLTPSFPEANLRHYAFLVAGLRECAVALAERGACFLPLAQSPDLAALAAAGGAALLVTDRGYLRIQRQWRARVAAAATCPVVQVETDAVVPVDAVSTRVEVAARTLRPRLHRLLDRFLVPLAATPLRVPSVASDLGLPEPADLDTFLRTAPFDRTVLPSTRLAGGARAARALLDRFVATELTGYAEGRSDPATDRGSHLSAHLHFGQISPLTVALAVRRAEAVPAADREAFMEELLVRRELSLNFVERNPAYDRYEGLPDWARRTLATHAGDARQYPYSEEQFEHAATHDPYWNAAQRELVATGRMHGYLRMYWGKKILEWSPTPEQAFATALRLNNRYELDGRDPNGFAGVAWCFGLHDRPWQERPVYGLVRCMTAGGLERKFDMRAYLARVDGLCTG